MKEDLERTSDENVSESNDDKKETISQKLNTDMSIPTIKKDDFESQKSAAKGYVLEEEEK